MTSLSLHQAMLLAVDEAKKYAGATSPNPNVGAAALDESGLLLGVCAHEKFGKAHAEVNLLRRMGGEPLHTVVVTLEPCCHQGKTPPCAQALIEAGIKRVVVGVEDPNPKVSSQGIALLRQAGIEVVTGIAENECRRLIAPFRKWVLTQRPWVILKRAFDCDGSMMPPAGKKTFTSRESLAYAHRLRRSCDAIITGSGTVLADDPHFTVRHVEDHPDKSRCLVVMDRKKLVPDAYFEQAAARGFSCSRGENLEAVLSEIGAKGGMRALVEAGPTLSRSFIERGLVDEEVNIVQKEEIAHVFRDY